ncbi:MAG: GTPase ObgE [Myxococcota bacterium]|nr:GTPase ObgE [Myxococcota bacterium]
MSFIDETQIRVMSGKGGDGCASFRRERHVPFGGPDGGDGGKGGDIVLVATRRRNTLRELRGHAIWKAKAGTPGMPRNCTGAKAKDVEIFVPVGTRILGKDGEQLIDLIEDEQRWIACKGGRGGLGNTRFKSSVNRAPRKATLGKPGEEKILNLELLLMADVGLLGFPNAGKSTLISSLSSAKPKIASYPFTTLAPSLGVVELGMDGTFVMADIPGLIEGAAEGLGLGHQFLRHVRRSRILLHLLSVGPDETEDIFHRYRVIRKELEKFDPSLAKRREFVALTKIDLISEQETETLRETFQARYPDTVVSCISSAQRRGLKELKYTLWNSLQDDT